MKTFVIVSVAFLVVVAGYLVSRPNAEGVIRIGYVSPLTGDAATYGVPMKQAAELAAEEINAAGGINGKRVELVFDDSKCNGKDALSAVQKLVSVDHIIWLSGFTCAEDLLTAAAFIEEKQVLALAPGASGPSVSQAGEYIFQTNPSATRATEQLVNLIRSEHERVAIINESTGFALDIEKHFTQEFSAQKGVIVASETYAPETKDFRAQLTKIREARPTAMFVNSQTEISGGLILKQARELGIDAQFYGLDTLSGPTVLSIAGESAEGAVFVTVPDLDPENERARVFLASYRERYGEPPFALYLAAAYDSIYLLSEAIGEAGEDTQKVRDYLYQLPEYRGAVGTYRFNQQGDLIGLDFIVKSIIDGTLVIQ